MRLRGLRPTVHPVSNVCSASHHPSRPPSMTVGAHHSMVHRALAATGLCAALALLVTACGAAPSTTVHKAPISVTFAESVNVDAQAEIAQHNGYFAAHGINATVTNYATGVEGLQGVLTGREDFAAGGAFAVLPYLKSDQLVIVSAAFRTPVGFYQLAVRAPTTFPQGLAGATFGLASGTDQVYQTEVLLQHYGLSLSKVKTVQFPDLYGLVAALHTGAISAAIVWQAGIPQAAAIPGVKMYPDTASGARETGFTVVSRSFLSRHYAAVVDALAALKEANTWMLAHMTAASRIIGSFVGISPTVLYPSMKGQSYTISWSSGDLAFFKSYSRQLLALHFISVLPNPKVVINSGPLAKVKG